MVDETPISPIPSLPNEMKEAVNNQRLAVFIGAGVSRTIGCMGWEQLAGNLLNRCYSLGLISYKEKETLANTPDHKKLITICHHLLTTKHEQDFFQELNKSLNADPKKVKQSNIYRELYGLRGLFVTTNVDTHFHFNFNSANIVYRVEDLEPLNIDMTKLYHIHSCILDKKSLVLTVRQYIERYNVKNFAEFIKRIFAEYIVLFVGYGTTEFELLDYLIEKHDPSKGMELKHFTLNGFYTGEGNILAYEQSYYRDLGIRVIPYVKDERGYDQVFEVIKSWNKEVNETTTYTHDTFDKIDEALINYTKPKSQEIFQIVMHDKSQEDYFLRKLGSTNTPSIWLTDLDEMAYFDPRKNPPPVDTPDKKAFTVGQWRILPYLENLTSHAATEQNLEITKALTRIVNAIIGFRNEAGERIENSYTDCAMIRIISGLPLSEITVEHIEFVGTALNSRHEIGGIIAGEVVRTLLPKLVNEHSKDLVLKLLSVIFQYRIESQYGLTRYTSVMGDFWLGEALQRFKTQIADLCGIPASDQVTDIMRNIAKAHTYSFLVIPSIEAIGPGFQDEYMFQLVSFVRDMYELVDPRLSENRIMALLGEEHVIFRRIAFFIINKHYSQLGHLLWDAKDNPFDDRYAWSELYGLLKSHCSQFSVDQISKVLSWIESADFYVPPQIKEQKQDGQYLAYRKKEWLSSLLETNNEEVKLLYEKYDKINPAPLEHPGSPIWTERGFEPVTSGRGVSYQNQTNQQIAEYLKVAIKGKENNEFLTDEISDGFRDAVRENPGRFSVDMLPFLEIPLNLQYALLLGLSEAWRAGRDFPWKELLDFMFELVSPSKFWKQSSYGQLSANPDCIASEIATLIENGTRDDKHAFAEELLPRAESILLILASRATSTAQSGSELIISVLNSPRGKTFSAMMQLSLRTARVSNVPPEARWVKSIKDDFTSRLDTNEKSFDFWVILGQYYPHLMYLDLDWAKKNVNRVFPRHDLDRWISSFSGYMFYASSIGQALYLLLRENEHYAMALKTDFPDKQVAARLVQHICIGYLRDFEKVEDEEGLLHKLLKDATLFQLSEIVGFLWLLRDELTAEMKGKVKPLWKEMYGVLLPKVENPEYRQVMADLSKWLSMIESIDDETLKWLLLSARCFRADYETTFFVEYLSQHASKSPKEVGRIYLQMLESGIYPQYGVEDIQAMVRAIYASDKETANRICNLYAARGIELLRIIFDEHRKEKT